MSLVSTDGHRLALITVPRDGEGSGEATRQAGRRSPRHPAAQDAARARPAARGRRKGTSSYERGENHLFFEVGGRLLISRMIDGQFPAFERVIPKGNDKRIEFDRDRLTSAVKRVALLSNERSRAVKFQIDKGKVEIASSSPEFGEAKEVLMVDYSGTPVTICFNAQYVARLPRRRRDRFGRRSSSRTR